RSAESCSKRASAFSVKPARVIPSLPPAPPLAATCCQARCRLGRAKTLSNSEYHFPVRSRLLLTAGAAVLASDPLSSVSPVPSLAVPCGKTIWSTSWPTPSCFGRLPILLSLVLPGCGPFALPAFQRASTLL